MKTEQMDNIFYPESVAVIGASASREKVGTMCVSNLLENGYKGKIYPVNANLKELLGLKAYPSVKAIPGKVGLAIVSVPASAVIPAVEDCIARGVTSILIVSSGFREVGTETGDDLQAKLKEIADKSGTKIIGPNTVGVINPHNRLIASFHTSLNVGRPGNVAVAAQSGGMCISIVHALTNNNVGISTAIGMGNRCNLDFDEVLEYFEQDEQTGVIILYIEGVDNPRKLMKVAKKVTRRKPVIVYKGGRSEESNKATFSHTGALAGKWEFYKTAFKQSGMILAESITDMVDMAKALDMQPPAPGNRVAVLSAQAGPGIIMADRCRELGLKLAEFSKPAWKHLRELVSPLNAVDNPVDLGWAGSQEETCREILKTILDDDGVEGVVLAVVYYAANMDVMNAVAAMSGYNNKPVTVCLDGPEGLARESLNVLAKSHVPAYPMAERAVTGLAGLVKYGEILKNR